MIIVCSLHDLESVCESVKPSHVISVIDPGYEPKTPKDVQNHLILNFDDIVAINSNNTIYRLPGTLNNQILPNLNHIKEIVKFSAFTGQNMTINVSINYCSFRICSPRNLLRH